MALQGRGGPRAGERAGGEELSWSSGVARRKEGRKKEAPTAGLGVSVRERRQWQGWSTAPGMEAADAF